MTLPRIKRALITGAGAVDGIGFAIARQLGSTGNAVFLTGASARVLERATELRAKGIDARAMVADLTKAADVARLRAGVGAIDILVNNAGMGSLASPSADKAFLAMTEADWDRGIDVSLKTAFLVTHAFLPAMIEAGYGRIVNVASVTGPLVSFEGTSAYSAAKAGMVGLTRTLALEVARSGVTVNAVAPGWIETGASSEMERTAALHTPPARAGRPDEVAAAVVFLASEGASYVNGALLVVDGGNSLQEHKG
ncbi:MULTISPECIES: SDR family oxidoreductase [Mesorhizobium]|uniref:Short-chain dehydrogenase n=1 Tax=Rhizobium loti TaxID=381 RepID=A0A6M7TU09_RHILI|nr:MULTISPECIES: SDR family NAD(P)-dependent oxidoreductase [Mesorhizobium]KRB20503.1 short-chain dehydrogenase [Mesorhizobium sp. Root172]OBQ65203.1 short-chain dehydrogenase [Mesorhizobium loti]QKC68312.1 SDR family oxidoreductase [Mesorhizobium loti]